VFVSELAERLEALVATLHEPGPEGEHDESIKGGRENCPHCVAESRHDAAQGTLWELSADLATLCAALSWALERIHARAHRVLTGQVCPTPFSISSYDAEVAEEAQALEATLLEKLR